MQIIPNSKIYLLKSYDKKRLKFESQKNKIEKLTSKIFFFSKKEGMVLISIERSTII